MRHCLKIGISFGLTSGIITTLGLIVGLHSGTHSELAVIGGLLTIAIADAFSDALGIHISEESENRHSSREIWQATGSTFAIKFFLPLTFMIPILLLELNFAIFLSVIYGLILLGLLSYYLSKEQNKGPWGTIVEHVGIALVVIIVAHYAGELIALAFA